MDIRSAIGGALFGAVAVGLVQFLLQPTVEVADAAAALPAEGAARGVPVKVPVPVPVLADRTSEDALEADIQLEELQRENALLREQLEQMGGLDIPFPDDLADAYREGPLREQLDAFAEQAPEVDRVDFDCSEYPCIAIYRLDDGAETSTEAVAPLQTAITEAAGQAGHSMSWHTSLGRGQDGNTYIAVAPMDPEVRLDEVADRLRIRIRDHLRNQGL